MSYTSKAEMIERFGEREIVQLTDRDRAGDVDDALLERAIADAAAEAETYIAARYTLPLPNVPPALGRVVADIARYRLYDDQSPEEVRDRYRDAVRWLERVARGEVTLAIAQVPRAVGVRAGEPVFTDELLSRMV